jgi:hypothetical protein
MTDAMLTRKNQRVCKQLLACWANELSFDILNSHLRIKKKTVKTSYLSKKLKLRFFFKSEVLFNYLISCSQPPFNIQSLEFRNART